MWMVRNQMKNSSGPVQVGQAADQFLEMLDTRLLDRLRVKHRDARGQVSSGALTIVRRNDNLFELLLRGHCRRMQKGNAQHNEYAGVSP